MFSNCSSLEFLDIRNFNTTGIKSMEAVFFGCKSLKSLDLSSFNTESVQSMYQMFRLCNSLTSLDLKNFYTPNLERMKSVFRECYSLEYIDIRNFNTTKVQEVSHIFSNCYSLKYVDISNFNTNSLTNMANMFVNCSELTSVNINNLNTELVTNMGHMFSGCYSLKSLNLSHFQTPNLEYIDHMFYNCNSLEYLDISNFNTEKINGFENMFFNTNALISLNLSNFTIKESASILNMLSDSNQNIILCYKESKMAYNFLEHVNSYENNCQKVCNLESKIFIPEEEKCIYSCYYSGTDYQYQYQNKCYKECPDKTKFNPDSKLCENMNQTEIISWTIENIINKYNESNLQNGNNTEIIEGNILIELSTTKNEKDNENINNNKVTIDIGECENELKNAYNISKNDSLYLLKLIVKEEGMKIPKVEYEIYYPLYNLSLTKLNLESCKNSKIDISISISIDDDIDKYNPDSKYYNDICSKATSDASTDINLKDRKNEFIYNNMSLCEENCKLSYYNYNTEKAKCSCDIKMKIPLIDDIKFNKDEFFKRFIDIKNIMNIKILKCFKEVFNGSLMHNFGFFAILTIILLFIIFIIIFPAKSFSILKTDINKIVKAMKKQVFYTPHNRKSVTINNKRNKKKEKVRKNSQKSNYLSINELKIFSNEEINAKKSGKNTKMRKSDKDVISQNKIKNGQKILKYEDFELNLLEYKDALKSDKRTYYQFYISLLKSRHLLIFSFWPFKDYNSRIIKIFLFFFFFSIHLTINALFFNDSTMHKIYEDKGSYNFIYQIPQILYSSIISGVINGLIRFLSLSQKNIIKLKEENEKSNINENKKKLLSVLKIKFALFFIITFIILLFCFYYISCFCGIYINTQTHLFKDSLISFILSLVYPFVTCLIPGILRIPTLRDEKGSSWFAYKLSTLLMLII